MARTKLEKIRESEVSGMKYFDKLAPLLERLHDDGCELDQAGNRRLHFDQYCLLILLHMLNPICSSLRAVQSAAADRSCRRCRIGWVGLRACGVGVVFRSGDGV